MLSATSSISRTVRHRRFAQLRGISKSHNAIKHPQRPTKTEVNRAKRLANLGRRRIVAKTAKTVHLRREPQIKWEIQVAMAGICQKRVSTKSRVI
ncbi:MAG: hypothetical protein ABSA83_10545 [Verrucomicrobiota bacterium]|jgi:hypothetical protein